MTERVRVFRCIAFMLLHRRSRSFAYVLVVALSLLFVSDCFSETHYVWTNSPAPATPYTNWSTAAHSIQPAVDAATDGDTVLVTNGVYDTGLRYHDHGQNRVVITNAITVRSVNGPEATTITDARTNAVRGVFMSGGCALAGFTITNFNSGDGGGVALTVDCIVSNCVLIGNGGGGAFLDRGGALVDCVLAENWTSGVGGGGAFLYEGGTLSGCTVSGSGVYLLRGGVLNECILTGNSGFYGSAAYLSEGGTLNGCTLSNNGGRAVYLFRGGILTNCTLTANEDAGAHLYQGGVLNRCRLTKNKGRGVLLEEGGTLNYCTISSNTSHFGAGAHMTGGTMNYCDLIGNSGSGAGGGAAVGLGATLNHCKLIGNSSGVGGGVSLESGTLNDCFISGNHASVQGGGVYASGGDVRRCNFVENVASDSGGGVYGGSLTNCTFSGNTATNNGGGAYLKTGDSLTDCTFSGNTAANVGGGVLLDGGGELLRCAFRENVAPAGGGLYMWNGGTADSCILSGNRASEKGGGAYLYAGGLLRNSTVSGNSAVIDGGGVRLYESGAEVRNCIVWGNTSSNFNDVANYLDLSTVSYTCASDGITHGLDGCITSDPMLVSLAETNLHLQTGSPCIDTGVVQPDVDTDFDGTPRPLDGDNSGTAHIDMGAYEYAHALVDADSDGMRDTEEVAAGTDPLSIDSFLGMSDVRKVDGSIGDIVVEWTSVAGKSYHLWRSTNLVEGTPSVILPDVPATPPLNTVTDTTATAGSPHFYWVELAQ